MPPGKAVREALSRLHRDGTRAHRLRRLSEEEFLRGAIEVLEKRLSTVSDSITSDDWLRLIEILPAHDFVLRIAFHRGDREEAVEALRRTLQPELERSYRDLGARPEQIEMYTAETLENLLVGAFRRSERPGFMTYEGKSSLASWARGIAWHDWHSRLRNSARAKIVPKTDLDAKGNENSFDVPDPASAAALEERELAAVLEGGLKAVLSATDPTDPDLLAYARSVLSKRQHRDLAERCGVPPSTYSRRKDRGERALARALRGEWERRFSPADLDELSGQLTGQGRRRPLVEGVVRSACRAIVRRAILHARREERRERRLTKEDPA